MDAGGDAFDRLALRAERDDFGLGEDHTLAGDLGRRGGLQGRLAQLVDGQVEDASDFLQEAPGARGALVVHHERLDLAVFRVDSNGLRVLPADVQDGADVGIEEVRSQGVRGNLGDDARRDVVELQGHAAVTGADDVADFVPRNPGGREQFVE